jgi:transcriptional regulator with XRE-family HTH domain
MEMALLTATDHQTAAGERLRAAIKACGLRYIQAAEIMGVTKNHLGNWMRGDGPIRVYELYRFCRVTGVTADWVLLGDPSGLPQRLAGQLIQPALSQEPAAV